MPLREALLMEQVAFMSRVSSEEVIQLMRTYIDEIGQNPEQVLDTP